jgi:hypothetical protein
MLTGCSGGRGEAVPTMATALEAVPLRRTGGQRVEVELADRQPAAGACEALPGARVRIRDAGLTVTVPSADPPPLPPGATRIVPMTTASYVVGDDGQATAWLDRTLATGPEDDVVAFVGVDISRSSSVAAVRAVTRLARVLDHAGVYAAVIQGPPGPPDEPGEDLEWSAAGVTTDGRVIEVRAAGDGPVTTTSGTASDPCAYRAAIS